MIILEKNKFSRKVESDGKIIYQTLNFCGEWEIMEDWDEEEFLHASEREREKEQID